MDVLTFVSHIFYSLAWPVVVIISVLLLKKPISQLVPLLHRLKYRDLELEFSKEVYKLADRVQKDLPTLYQRYSGDIDDNQLLAYDVQHSPRTAILESWLKLESIAIDVLRTSKLDFTKATFISPRYIAQSLQRAEILDKKHITIFNKLRQLRNIAVHSLDFDMDPDAVAEFVYLTKMLIDHIKEQ